MWVGELLMGGTSMNSALVVSAGGLVVLRFGMGVLDVVWDVAPACGRRSLVPDVLGFWHTVGSWDNRTDCLLVHRVVGEGVVVPGWLLFGLSWFRPC